ncbi:glycerate kinase type-2 family protein [Methanococcoides sp. FTZ1]|uniref:glycerate kinase type-2 family protein n=1 Tax=Methanococcoides sp. FTZ1 TaxID=3439061 RepID=UPI003F87A0D8
MEDRCYDFTEYRNIYLISFGKAACKMASELEDILGKFVTDGIVLTKYGYSEPKPKNIPVFEAGHPLPDENGILATGRILDLLEKADEADLVFFLISGGGSALLTYPRENIELTDVVRTTDLLLKAGATIEEMNTIRKHLSDVKGGGLARSAYPARSISLVISDVVGNPMDVIASGPTVPDTSTFQDFESIVRKYELELPQAVRKLLEDGLSGIIDETPKKGDVVFDNCHHLLIGNNSLALSEAYEQASDLGYNTVVLTSSVTGEAREVAKVFASIAREERTNERPFPLPACIIAGGETTVNVTGQGKGGRCQEFALSFAVEVSGLENVLLLAAGTDGTDGPTDAAGAFAGGNTITRGKEAGLSASSMLSQNDSYTFFEKLDDLFITGPTGTNVMDIYLLLIGLSDEDQDPPVD